MTKNTVTLALGGDVPLDQFADTMGRLNRLIDLLTQDLSRDTQISWFIDELLVGSAVVSIRGEAEQPEAVERIARAYAVIGESLEHNQPIPYPPQIVRAAESLTQVLNGQITSIQFEAVGEVATVTSSVPVEQAAGLIGAYGSVEGRIETLTSRRGLGFTLYDVLHDRAIRCHLEPEQADAVRDAWGHQAIVTGWVRRDPTSGRPVTINPVRSVARVPEVERGAYRRARAIAPSSHGDVPPHVAIRRLRDA
ncbi:MAG: hypothetical protein ACRDJC_08560 [Thermomicrobiales bacterium]